LHIVISEKVFWRRNQTRAMPLQTPTGCNYFCRAEQKNTLLDCDCNYGKFRVVTRSMAFK